MWLVIPGVLVEICWFYSWMSIEICIHFYDLASMSYFSMDNNLQKYTITFYQNNSIIVAELGKMVLKMYLKYKMQNIFAKSI